MEEHVLSLNNFQMPKVFDANDAAYVLIVRLLLLDPGKYQSHPEMGVGLRTRYRDRNDENFLLTLQSDVHNQILSYLPWLNSTDVEISIKNNVLGIVINTAEGAYVIGYDGDNDTLDAAATYVLEDL